ncbi:TrmH family RNA methyltransferase [Flagellimonas flava]|uniref:TrmH family RNA methyltransferase n=1 Tax=Flagellimonas flava TaxID=570519 RepID=UPI003D656FE6
MVTKNQIKLVTSLQQKKYRSQHRLFVVEGKKSVGELLAEGLVPFKIFVDPGMKGMDFGDVVSATTRDLKQMSGQTTPSGVLGVFHMPEPKESKEADWIVALDAVRDPGNLGTIIRLCDWFGIKHLVCSPDTVDCYNPKVLQATMGSIARVQIDYMELLNFLKTTNLPVYGAFMDGETVYKEDIPKKGILVMGNEANGISKEVEQAIAKRVSIPQFGVKSAESLNVATATAILLNEIRRNS